MFMTNYGNRLPPQTVPLRLDGHLTTQQIDELRIAIAGLSFADTLSITLNPPSENGQPQYTHEGFPTRLLEYVEADNDKNIKGGWYVSWFTFRDFSLADRDEREKGKILQRATTAYQSLARAMQGRISSEHEANLTGSPPLAGIYHPSPRRKSHFKHNYTEVMVEPQGLIELFGTRQKTIDAGMPVRTTASDHLLLNYVQALQPDNH
jgi:hypothetical protein